MRGIIGAVLNNLLLMKTRGMFICVIMALCAMVAYLVTDNAAARQASILVFLLLLPLASLNASNIAFDSKWNRIEMLWGVSRFAMIASRYIIYAVISLTLSALWVLSPFHDGNIQNIADFVTLVLFIGALYYPTMYLLNTDHNIGLLIIIIATVVGLTILNWLVGWLHHSWADGFSFVLLGAVCGAYVASLLLSSIFNHIHMGRGA
ncbi:MAG: ABC-2 transporter permease [Defluviitaleaceae bacterium]|nr:ABC-2 transporter permease [Defluviitaleaceae bacterium]